MLDKKPEKAAAERGRRGDSATSFARPSKGRLPEKQKIGRREERSERQRPQPSRWRGEAHKTLGPSLRTPPLTRDAKRTNEGGGGWRLLSASWGRC